MPAHRVTVAIIVELGSLFLLTPILVLMIGMSRWFPTWCLLSVSVFITLHHSHCQYCLWWLSTPRLVLLQLAICQWVIQAMSPLVELAHHIRSSVLSRVSKGSNIFYNLAPKVYIMLTNVRQLCGNFRRLDPLTWPPFENSKYSTVH